MSEAEFVTWSDGVKELRVEWEDGEVIVLSPDSVDHDALLVWLFNLLHPFVEHHDLGLIVGPNVTTRFARQKRRRIPDVLFVAKARLNLVRTNHIEGAPDLTMEVVSPDSQSRDRRKKFHEYERAGVREYWIIDPLSRIVEAYTLRRGKFAEIPVEKDAIRSVVLPGFYLKPAWLWRRPLPKALMIQKELGLI